MVKRGVEKYLSGKTSYLTDFPSTVDIALMDVLHEFSEEINGLNIPLNRIDIEALCQMKYTKKLPDNLNNQEKESIRRKCY